MTTQTQVTEKSNFPAMLNQYLPEIRRALPKHLDGDRMARIALTAFRRTPKLADCDPRSVFAAVIQASQLGLEPDTLGRSYLVPYKKSKKIGKEWHETWECNFVPGWRGLVDLVSRAGQATVWTGAVYKGDQFEYRLGDSPRCDHLPGDFHGEGDPTHVYACGKVKGSDLVITEVWSIARVKLHRDKYNKVGDKHYSFENLEMYARKVVLLQVIKYMPMSPDLVRAIELDNAAANGPQNLVLDDAIKGEWTPVIDEPQEEKLVLPVLSDEEFNLKKADTLDHETGEIKKMGWRSMVQSGKKTTDEIIQFIASKNSLTESQTVEIKSWKE